MAKWIWIDQTEADPYNQTILDRRKFHLDQLRSGRLRITADSFYCLLINGEWVNDGPCRSWREHFQCDELDVGSYVRDGSNEIKVIARYYGVGDSHRNPKQPGLLAQLDVTEVGGKIITLVTDASWEARGGAPSYC